MLGREIRDTFLLASPLILAQLAQMSMSLVDTIMVGRLGSLELAGVALGSAVLYPSILTSVGILTAVSPMVSQGYGAGDRRSVERAVRQGLWLGTLLAIPACLLIWHGTWLLRWIGHEERTIRLAEAYLHAIVWGVPPLLWFAVLRHFLEGLSRPRVILGITMGGVGLNIAANYVLMYGKLGFPALGLAGCGWASTLVFWGMLLVMVLFAASEKGLTSYRVFSRLGKSDWHYFSEILHIGWPIGIMQGLEVSLFATTTFLMGLFGTTALAAHQIALQCASCSFMVPLGLSRAVSVRVGQAMGRRDLPGARRAGYVGLGLGAGFMMAAALCFWCFPETIIGLFLDVTSGVNQEVVSKAVVFLSLAALFQVSDGVQVTAAGALRGWKDTRMPMVVALIAYWLVGLSSGYTLGFQLDWDGDGLWWGKILGLTTSAILLSWRFRRQIRIADLNSESRRVAAPTFREPGPWRW